MSHRTRKAATVLVLLVTTIAGGAALVPSCGSSKFPSHAASLSMNVRRFRQLATTMAEEYETREMAFALFQMSSQELQEYGIDQVNSQDGPYWSIASCSTRASDTDAIFDALDKISTPLPGASGLGCTVWYVPRNHFFIARKALLKSSIVRSLGINVVTPRYHDTRSTSR